MQVKKICITIKKSKPTNRHDRVHKENSINAHFPNKHHSVNEENSMIMSTIKINKKHQQTSQSEQGKQHKCPLS